MEVKRGISFMSMMLHDSSLIWRQNLGLLPKAAAYNVATGTGVTLLELVRLIRSALHTHGRDSPALEPVFEEERPGDIRKSIANVLAISEDIGWNADVSLQQGIAAMIDERLADV